MPHLFWRSRWQGKPRWRRQAIVPAAAAAYNKNQRRLWRRACCQGAKVVKAPAAWRASPPNAVLALASGETYAGWGAGAEGIAVGELCFNTAMTGYQEIMTDPSYSGQIVVFTFPHIGNVGANGEDMESAGPAAGALVTAAMISEPSNYRAESGFADWLEKKGLTALCGVDTRALTRRLRDGGAQAAALGYRRGGAPDVEALLALARQAPSLKGRELAAAASCRSPHQWEQTVWSAKSGYGRRGAERFRVTAVDYGAKHNLFRHLASLGARVTVLPARASAADILASRPDGVFLSNGPGDPAATAEYASAAIRGVLDAGVPLFGVCLGHQLLALTLGARTEKMRFGHHGANHPVRNLLTGRVEITCQNHGFLVNEESLPDGVKVTHRSLFDGTIEGLESADGRAFSVQHHPEASPGPRDAGYLFARFAALAGKT